MEAMMKAKVAFFDPKCKLNRACFPLDSIPSALRKWMQETLMGDLREPAPKDFDVVAVVKALSVLLSSKKFKIEKLFTGVGDILEAARHGIKRYVLTNMKWYSENQAYDLPKNVKPGAIKVCLTTNDDPVLAWIENAEVKLMGTRGMIPISLNATQLVCVNGRIIALYRMQATEITLKDLGTRIQPLLKKVGQIMDIPNATKAYSGCVIQNMLGSWRVNTFPDEGSCISTRLIDLEGSQIVDAKYENGVLMVIGGSDYGYP
jgi:hypothetical protein